MIGLPLPGVQGDGGKNFSEETEIVKFICNISRKTSMRFNVNVGIFVPKPHTPYQWARQIDGASAASKLMYIRSRLTGHKVSTSDPLVSVIEGILSRGDERAGYLAEQVFLSGSRLDAWHEYIAKETWQKALDDNSGLVDEILKEKDITRSLPWQPIFSGVSASFLQNELEKSGRGELSPRCSENCISRCGLCGGDAGIVRNSDKIYIDKISTGEKTPENGKMAGAVLPEIPAKPDVWRLLFSFTKEGSAVFHGHLSLIEIFSMAFTRSGIDVMYTQGFNPLAKMEIAAPLSTGISSGGEIAAADFDHEFSAVEFIDRMNKTMPEGIIITGAECYRIKFGGKKHSLSSLLWGFAYSGGCGETVYVPAAEEKNYRKQSGALTNYSLRRVSVLAKNILSGAGEKERPWASYFDTYSGLYVGNSD
jgi:hypothetical protein